MANTDARFEILDFSGGLNSFDPEFAVAANQAIDLDNINLLGEGKSFQQRNGNVKFNSSAMVSATSDVNGLHYMKFNSGTEFLNATCGGKFFTSSGLTGTMADKTGGLSISSNQDDYWNAVNFNDLQVWFGGAPNPPFKHDGTASNASLLGGSPPTAKYVFQANNRVFACSTTANPSRLYWSVLSDPEDWTSTGSGNQDITKNDGEELLVGVPLGNNQAILFKNSSTHRLILDLDSTALSFPVYQLQRGVGLAGRRAFVMVNGIIYFITPSKRMKATADGVQFIDFPSTIDDKWDEINDARVDNIVGIYYDKLKQIHWYISTDTNTENNKALIWDLRRKCWLQNTTGFTVNTAALVQNRRLFTGHYDGTIYEQDKENIATDASTTSGTIDAYWETGWLTNNTFSKVIHPRWLDISVLTQTSGTFEVSYGFDFAANTKTTSIDMATVGGEWNTDNWNAFLWGGQQSTIERVFMRGRGQNFNMRFRNRNNNENFTVQGATLAIRPERDRKQLELT